MIKKIFFIIFLGCALFLSEPARSFANILYSNDFLTSYSGFYTFFGSCFPAQNGLSCGIGAQGVYSTTLNNLVCVYGTFTVVSGKQQLDLWQNADINNLGKGAIYYIRGGGHLSLGNYPTDNAIGIDSGITTPPGKHTYGLCKNLDTYTTYVDGHIIQKEIFSGLSPNQIGFQLENNSTLTNFTATDTLPETTIPILKQTDPAWGSQTYDGADNWDPQHKTIGDWGCAMTSAAMVLKSYGINKLPDGTELDPGTLNTWLKNQSDGYIDGLTSGYMNPLAITRLAKQAISVNNITSFDALEYQHISGADKTQLANDLNNSQPDMLEVPGHFIVATAVNGNTFDINDPYYERKNLNEGYNNTFLSLNRYIPSHTDLSYILMTINPNIAVTIKDQNGQAIGDQFIQQPYADPLNNNHPGGNPLKMIFIQKPPTGTYKITLSGANDQNYKLQTYLYDKNGNVNTNISQGTVGTKSDSFTITFNNQDSTKSTSTRVVTFQSFIDDINENIQLHQINKNIGNAIIPLIQSAKESADKNQKLAAKLKLEAIELTLKALRGKGISETAFQFLLSDEQYLKNHL